MRIGGGGRVCQTGNTALLHGSPLSTHPVDMTAADDNRVVLIGRTNYRNRRQAFGIRQADRRHHMYLIGKTGTGKSTLLETLIRQDVASGQGVAVVDPHGDLVEHVLATVPPTRRDDVIYFDVPNTTAPLGFNPLSSVPPASRAVAASGMLDVFKKLWSDSWGPRLEHILRNALLLLLDQPEATLADVLRLLDDEEFMHRAVGRTANAQVRRFWLHEFNSYPKRFRIEAISPIQNKVGAFLANPILQQILTRQKSAFDLRRLMDERKVLLVNLAKGRLGEDSATLLGSLLASHVGLAALSRAEVPEHVRPNFFLYLDEFHSFTTLSLTGMLSELRKYRVGLVLANQYLSQLDERIRDAVLGNVGTLVAFRVGPDDAELLEKELQPEFSAKDLVNLPNYSIYVRLMVDGRVSRPFSAETLAPPPSAS